MICIPMAGKSSRFYEAGFTKPKFELEVGSFSLFRLSLMSFAEYFHSETFLFVLNSKTDSLLFLENELKTLQISNYRIFQLEGETRGQADTVAIALASGIADESEHLLVFNIDTIRPGFKYPEHFPNFPWLETFHDFLSIFQQFETSSIDIELYVAPLYQSLIDQGRTVKYSVINSTEIFLAGTPPEFLALNSQALLKALKL